MCLSSEMFKMLCRRLLIAGAIVYCPLACWAGEPAHELSPSIIRVLDSADKATLYSLEPDAIPSKGQEVFARYQVLGKIELSKKQTKIAANEFRTDVVDWNGIMPNCFDPRHALRIVAHNHIYDFVLCFQCGQLMVSKDDKCVAWVQVGGTPEVLNSMLTEAHIPLSQSDKTDK